MPCTAPVRGKTDFVNPWEPLTDNDPCGQPILTAVGGMDVSAQNLCAPHYAMKYGLGVFPPTARYDTQTVLLLHGDSLQDEKGHPLAALGGAAVSTAQSVFGGSSLFFDGAAGSKLSTPDSPDWSISSGDWAVDFRIRFATIGTFKWMIAQYNAATNQRAWGICMGSTTSLLQFTCTTDGINAINNTFAWTPVVNQWYHVAITRENNVLRAFVDGTQIGSPITQTTSAVYFDSPAPLTIGGITDSGGEFNGWLDEVRISKGIARWTSNFSVPTAPYT